MFCGGLKKKSVSCTLQNNMINNNDSKRKDNSNYYDSQSSSFDIYETQFDPNVNIILNRDHKKLSNNKQRLSKLKSKHNKNKSNDNINTTFSNNISIKNDYSVYSMFKYDINNNCKNNDVNLIDAAANEDDGNDDDDGYEYIYYDNMINQTKNVNKKTMTATITSSSGSMSLFKKLTTKSSSSITINNNNNNNSSSLSVFSYLKKKFKFGSSKCYGFLFLNKFLSQLTNLWLRYYCFQYIQNR